MKRRTFICKTTYTGNLNDIGLIYIVPNCFPVKATKCDISCSCLVMYIYNVSLLPLNWKVWWNYVSAYDLRNYRAASQQGRIWSIALRDCILARQFSRRLRFNPADVSTCRIILRLELPSARCWYFVSRLYISICPTNPRFPAESEFNAIA